MKAIRIALLASALVLGCGPGATVNPTISAGQAATTARDLVIAGQPSGTVFHDLTVATPVWQSTHWRVAVDAVIDYPPPTAPGSHTPIHYLIDVDGATGRATIAGQG